METVTDKITWYTGAVIIGWFIRFLWNPSRWWRTSLITATRYQRLGLNHWFCTGQIVIKMFAIHRICWHDLRLRHETKSLRNANITPANGQDRGP